MSAPMVRILHMLPRSGGTVIARCLGCMDNVVLLSEVHPRASEELTMLDPVWQAQAWFGFFADLPDAHRALADEPFSAKIGRISAEAMTRNSHLVLRDWTHLDFTGFPHVRDPSCRFSILDALQGAFAIRNVALVRHPLPQFRSHRALMLTGASDKSAFIDKWFTPEFFARAYLLYAREATKSGYCRYEDFLAKPERFMKALCASLDLSYDDGYRDRWRDYRTVTGAVEERTDDIRTTPRVALPAALEVRLRASADYATACALLGYDADGP